MADETAPTKRVELIDDPDRSGDGLPGYIGVGLIAGIVLGSGPLRHAVQGTGPFEDAMLRFLACILVCVAAASFIGRILDSAPPARDDAEVDAGSVAGSDSDGDPAGERPAAGDGGGAGVDDLDASVDGVGGGSGLGN